MSSSSVVPESDQELLLALGQGTPHAIALLYQRHGSRMETFARRYVDDQGAAEDVVSSLLGRWLEHPPRVHDVERIGAFLAVSVYHAAIDWMRRERAERGQSPRDRAAGSGDGRRGLPLANPVSTASRESLQSRLSAALARMSGSDRLLLETHYGRALTAEECMDEMRINRAAFHQRLHRARTRMARLLADDETSGTGAGQR